MQIYEKSSNNERKREKRFVFCGFRDRCNTILAVILRGTGEKIRANRERDRELQGEKRHLGRFGRPPTRIRAGDLIYWSARPDICERSDNPCSHGDSPRVLS